MKPFEWIKWKFLNKHLYINIIWYIYIYIYPGRQKTKQSLVVVRKTWLRQHQKYQSQPRATTPDHSMGSIEEEWGKKNWVMNKTFDHYQKRSKIMSNLTKRSTLCSITLSIFPAIITVASYRRPLADAFSLSWLTNITPNITRLNNSWLACFGCCHGPCLQSLLQPRSWDILNLALNILHCWITETMAATR